MHETLAKAVGRIMEEKALSSYDVERKSDGGITHSYVYKIKTGSCRNPSSNKLKGLARGLDVSEEIIFAAARGKEISEINVVSSILSNLNEKYSALPKAKRNQARDLIAMIEREFDRLLG